MDCECQTDPLDYGKDDKLKNNKNATDLNQQKLYEVLGQLSLGVTELNPILHDERIKSQALLEENFKLRSELRATPVVCPDAVSRSNKEIHEHNGITTPAIVPNEKVIDSPQKKAIRKNKKRRGRSNINKSTDNDKDLISEKNKNLSCTVEQSSSQTSSAAKDPIVEPRSESNPVPNAGNSSKQLPNNNKGAWPKTLSSLQGTACFPISMKPSLATDIIPKLEPSKDRQSKIFMTTSSLC